jgi:hypothetical protein
MSRIRLLGLAAVLVAATMTTACKQSPGVGTVRAGIEQQIPGAEFEREFHMKLGRMSMGLAKKIARFGFDEEDEELDMLRAVKRVDIGTYRVIALPPIDELELPPGLVRQLSTAGWEVLLREQSEGERTWVFVHAGDKGTLTSVYVVVLDKVELTMVAVEGRLDELIASAIADDPDGFISSLGG